MLCFLEVCFRGERHVHTYIYVYIACNDHEIKWHYLVTSSVSTSMGDPWDLRILVSCVPGPRCRVWAPLGHYYREFCSCPCMNGDSERFVIFILLEWINSRYVFSTPIITQFCFSALCLVLYVLSCESVLRVSIQLCFSILCNEQYIISLYIYY